MSEKREELKKYAEENGLLITGTGYDIRQGDYYIALRNTGPKLLTCREVDKRGWVVPVELAYCYDTYECLKVKFDEKTWNDV